MCCPTQRCSNQKSCCFAGLSRHCQGSQVGSRPLILTTRLLDSLTPLMSSPQNQTVTPTTSCPPPLPHHVSKARLVCLFPLCCTLPTGQVFLLFLLLLFSLSRSHTLENLRDKLLRSIVAYDTFGPPPPPPSPRTDGTSIPLSERMSIPAAFHLSLVERTRTSRETTNAPRQRTVGE